MMDVLRIGLIGAGRIGRIHGENSARFIPAARLEGLADIAVQEEQQTWAKGLGVRLISTNPQDILEDPAIDAVMICSATDTHADLISVAAAAGKHIFCEKPIDLSVPRVKAALAVVKKAGVTLQVGFNRRFDRNFKRIRELTLAGEIGDVQLIKITSRDPAPPPRSYVAVSGGIFMDMMIHDFDMARFQAGSEITQVYAMGAVLIDPEIGEAGDVDTAVVSLTFANGALGVIDNSRKAVYGYDQRVEVFGSKGAALAENETAHQVTLAAASGLISAKPLHFFLERYQGAYRAELASFVDAVLHHRSPEVSGQDGLENMYAALAAGKSLKEKRPVSIAEVRAE